MDHDSHHPARLERASTGRPRPIAWVDGRVLPASEATVPLTDEGFLRGDAVFEAVLVRRGRTHALDAHLARMRRSAKFLDLRLPVLRQVVADLLAAWGERDGVLRLIVTRGGTVRGLVEAPTWPDTLALAVIETTWRSPITGVKTLSYAANQWLIRQARARDADDALIVDDGLALELPTGSLCVVQDGEVSSPDPDRLPILDSVTVRAVAEVVDIRRDVLSLEQVLAADELFVASATRPVLPVHAVVLDDQELRFDAPGPVTATVRDKLRDHIEATLDPVP